MEEKKEKSYREKLPSDVLERLEEYWDNEYRKDYGYLFKSKKEE